MIRLDILDAAAFAARADGDVLPDASDGWLALRIPNGRVMGGAFLPVSSDMTATTLDRMVPYAARWPKWLNWSSRRMLPVDGGVATPPPERLLKLHKAAIIGGMWNFGHFIMNFAPRVLALRALLPAEEFNALTWLVWADAPQVHLDILTDLIGGAPNFHRLPNDVWAKADTLYAPAMLNYGDGDNIAHRYDYVPLFRARLHRAAQVDPAAPRRRLLISRANAPKRRLRNEAAVAERLAPYGFEQVALETWPWREQVRAIAAADQVVAVFGAGWTLNFLRRPGGGLVIVAPETHGMTDEMVLEARMIGVDLRLVPAQEHPGPHAPGDNDMTVDPEAALTALRDVGAL